MSEDPKIPAGEDLAESAAAVLRGRVVPMGPSPVLVRATLARVRKQEFAETAGAASGSAGAVGGANRFRPLMRIAASVIVLVGVGAIAMWMLAGGGGSQVAFADVLENIKKAKSVQFTLERNFEFGRISREATVKSLVVEGGKMRLDVSAGAQDFATVVDLPAHRALVLFPEQKRAVPLSFDKTPESLKRLEDFQLGDLIDHVKAWTDKDGQPAGKTKIDGRDALEFRVSRGKRKTTLWVDPATRLPIRISIDVTRPNGAAANLTFHDIKWDEAFDPALISCDVPVDFTAEKPPTEHDLIDSLRAVAAFTGGSFPEDWSLKALATLVQKSSVAGKLDRKAASATPLAERRQQNRDRFMTVVRGLAFAGNADCGDDWHYSGVDAHLNDKDRPLLWYRPIESEMYRVIYADLSVRDAAKADLPQRPSMVIPQPNMGGAKIKFQKLSD